MGFKGLEKLKRLECLRQPVCSPSSIQENASKSERRKKVSKSTDSNRGIPSDNTNLEKKEKLAKRRLEKLRKEKEEREKQEKEKKEEKEKRDKEKMDDEERDKLLVNVVHEGNTMMENLRILNLKPQICFRDNICDPINLYHKVGHGKLDMYVLNPSKESREVREFLSRWNDDSGHLGKFKSGINVDGKELWLPIANLVSICALIIWYPANPNDTITRLLFPGSTPQHKIFKGLEKLKRLECLRQPVCSPSSIQESASKSERRKKVSKSTDSNRGIPSDNTNLEKKEKLAKRRLEKLR